jgi:LysM repeat protein
MQTMPAKTRAAVTVAAALLAVVIGALALWSGGRTKNTPVNPDALNQDAAVNLGETPPTGGTNQAETPADSTNTPAQAETAIPATHTVKDGESLYDISRLYYKTHIYAGAIEAANGITDPNTIFAGMELKLPHQDDLDPATTTATPDAASVTTPEDTPTSDLPAN